MTYSVKLLSGENILLGQWHEDFSFQDEMYAYNNEALDILDSLTAPVYVIHEFANPALSMQDIMTGASIATRGEKPSFQHPMIKEIIFVTTSQVIKVAAKGLNSMPFGNVDVTILDTVDEARAFVRSQSG